NMSTLRRRSPPGWPAAPDVIGQTQTPAAPGARCHSDPHLTARESPWQNPFAERLIGSMRRECLNHVRVLGERHLRRILTRYSLTTMATGCTGRPAYPSCAQDRKSV